jgi:hypothetical protein
MIKKLLCSVCFLTTLNVYAADLCTVPPEAKTKPQDTPVPLCLVAQKIAATLDEYNRAPGTIAGALPKLSRAVFGFKTVSSTTSGFKFSVLVFSFGASHRTDSTNAVSFAYVVPPPETRPPGFSTQQYLDYLGKKPPPKDFSKELIQTLQEAAEQIKLTDSVGAAKFKTLTVSLAYGVTWDFNGGATLPISLVTLGGSLDHSRADTQTIDLTFEDPPKPKAPPIKP